MSAKQTRRTISLSMAMATAVRARAETLGIPVSQYVHETLVAEMTKAGVQAPEHRKYAHGGSERAWSPEHRRWMVVAKRPKSKRGDTRKSTPEASP